MAVAIEVVVVARSMMAHGGNHNDKNCCRHLYQALFLIFNF